MSSAVKKRCRTCLTLENLTPLFENLDAVNMLKKCIKIRVEEGDGLPDNICTVCLEELFHTNKFYTQCHDIDEVFQCYLETKKSQQLLTSTENLHNTSEKVVENSSINSNMDGEKLSPSDNFENTFVNDGENSVSEVFANNSKPDKEIATNGCEENTENLTLVPNSEKNNKTPMNKDNNSTIEYREEIDNSACAISTDNSLPDIEININELDFQNPTQIANPEEEMLKTKPNPKQDKEIVMNGAGEINENLSLVLNSEKNNIENSMNKDNNSTIEYREESDNNTTSAISTLPDPASVVISEEEMVKSKTNAKQGKRVSMNGCEESTENLSLVPNSEKNTIQTPMDKDNNSTIEYQEDTGNQSVRIISTDNSLPDIEMMSESEFQNSTPLITSDEEKASSDNENIATASTEINLKMEIVMVDQQSENFGENDTNMSINSANSSEEDNENSSTTLDENSSQNSHCFLANTEIILEDPEINRKFDLFDSNEHITAPPITIEKSTPEVQKERYFLRKSRNEQNSEINHFKTHETELKDNANTSDCTTGNYIKQFGLRECYVQLEVNKTLEKMIAHRKRKDSSKNNTTPKESRKRRSSRTRGGSKKFKK